MTAADPRPLAGRRILVVARWYPAFDARSSGVFVADHVRLLRDAGAEVVVASWDATPLVQGPAADADRLGRAWADAIRTAPPIETPQRWGAGVPVVRLPAVTRPTAGGRIDEAGRVAALSTAQSAFGDRLHATWPIQLVHAHTGLPDGVVAAGLADRLGVPLVTTEHDRTLLRRLRDPAARRTYRGLTDRRHVLVAVSPAFADALAGVLEAPVGVLPNPIDLDAFPPGDPAVRHPGELLWVGGRQPSKGIATLLEAFAIVRTVRPEARLRMLGLATPDDDAAWRARAAQLGIPESVSFEPVADRAAIAAAMQRASVFVHPSPFETFGIVAAEALASGLPVACTPSGVEQIVGRDGVAGAVARDFEARSLADAILAVVARPAPDASVLRARVAERYAPAAIARATVDLYAPLLGPLSAGPASLPEPAAAPARPIVIAFRRAVLDDRIAALDARVRASLTILTTTVPSGRPSPAGVERWVEIDDDAEARRALAAAGSPPKAGAIGRLSWFVRHPLATIERRRIARRRPSDRLAERRLAVAALLSEIRRSRPDAPIDVVVLDSDDRLAAEPFLAGDVRIAPGGLRWLADAHDARVATNATGHRVAAPGPATDA